MTQSHSLSESHFVDYYALLGIPHDASSNDIKRAYHRAVLIHHPDKINTNNRRTDTSSSQSDAEIHMLNAAYEILRVETSRTEYDVSLRARSLESERKPSAPRPAQVVSLEDFHFQIRNRGGRRAVGENANTNANFNKKGQDDEHGNVNPNGGANTNGNYSPNGSGDNNGGNGQENDRAEASAFEFESQSESESEGEGEWTYPCRCGNLYRITETQMEDGVHIVGCEGCSEAIWVGYEVVEDEDAAVEEDVGES